MNLLFPTIATIFTIVFVSCQSLPPKFSETKQSLLYPGEEKFLKNIRQLTFGGQNAEAYFSEDGNWIVFQSHRNGHPCDELYAIRVDGSDLRKLSTGKGRVTCGYFLGKQAAADAPEFAIYASTHDFGAECPAPPAGLQGYAWPIYSSYELYSQSFANNKAPERLTNNTSYDAEATVSPDQRSIVFTSTRDGDLDLYIMDVATKSVRRVTNSLGYDGGAFFSHDGKKLIYRAFHPSTNEERTQYLSNLKNGYYRPSWLELFMIDIDGTNRQQITNLKGASFAPFLFPSDSRVIFSTNHHDPKRRKFNLFAINTDGTNLEQITFSDEFDSFPMFSPDGKYIVWASNRNGTVPRETNVFVAEWVGPL